MLTDQTQLLDFINQEKVATLAVPIDADDTLHVATMHYVHQLDPFTFYFVTQAASEKCRLLGRQSTVQAACTVGTYVQTPFTLQMRGTAQLLSVTDHPEIMDTYNQKRNSKNKNVEGQDVVILAFTPDWARFTDYSKGWDTTMLTLP